MDSMNSASNRSGLKDGEITLLKENGLKWHFGLGESVSISVPEESRKKYAETSGKPFEQLRDHFEAFIVGYDYRVEGTEVIPTYHMSSYKGNEWEEREDALMKRLHSGGERKVSVASVLELLKSKATA